MAKPGAKTLYRADHAKQAAKLCAIGATDVQVADFFGICKKTLYTWKHAHPEFVAAMKVGKEAADDRVESSLYHKAVGYEHDDVHFSSYEGVVTATPYVKHLAPDAVAAIFWLKNRRPDKWRDKQEFGLTDKAGNDRDLTDLELARRVAFALVKGVDGA